MTEIINLRSLNMNHFTIQDAELYCQISSINPDNITDLDLGNNELEDISGISIFKNLKRLNLDNNKIEDLSPLRDLIDLKRLDIDNLNLTDELKTVKILKSLTKLEALYCINTFKIIDIKKELKWVKNFKYESFYCV